MSALESEARPEDGPALAMPRYRELLTRAREGLFIARPVRGPGGQLADLEVLEVNPAFEKVTGQPAAAVLGRGLSEAMPVTAARLLAECAGPAEDGETVLEIHIPGLDDRWFEARVSWLDAAHVAVFLMDITARKEVEASFDASRDNLKAIVNFVDQMIWSTRPDGYHDFYNRRWYEFTGVPDGSTDGEGWNDMFHADDQARAWEQWSHCLATGEPYEIEYRLRHRSGEYRWVLGRAHAIRGDDGSILRWMGTCTDIHDQKRTAEQLTLLSQELSHRIKNIFAVIAGLVTFAARRHNAPSGFARDLNDRIAALGRAHDYARPHSPQSAPRQGTATALDMLRLLLEPYSEGGTRIRIEGEDIGLDDRGATPFALIFHELATNAAKYGALSAHDGVVTIRGVRGDGEYRIVWTESGGPTVSEPATSGFGTMLAELSARDQLGGDYVRRWNPEGLEVELIVPDDRLSRQPDARAPSKA